MRQKLLRAVVLLLTILFPISLLAGCDSKTKPVVTQTSQMNDASYTIGVPTGATAVSAVESTLPKAKMKYYSSLPDAYLAVQQGKVDAFAFDRYLLGFAIANGLDGVKMLPGDVGEKFDVAIGISRKTQIPNLQQKINDCLSELRDDGTLDDMFQRWVVNADDTMPNIPKPEHPTMTLKVGTSGVVQPFSYYIGNELTGYDLELAARLALYLNAEIEIKVYDYDGFPSAAESGAIDCILANLNDTKERRETMDFSTPLYQSQTALLVQDEEATNEEQASERHIPRVSVESARIGVMEGSTNEVYAEEHYPEASILNFKNYVDSTAALNAGKLDYALMDYTSALRFIHSNQTLEIASDALTDEKVCLGFSKNQPELAQKVSVVVDKYIADGTMNEIISHWIKSDGTDYDVVETPKLAGAPKVKVAIIASREPTTFLLDGKYAGLDIELIDRALYELGYQAEYLDMELGAVIASIDSNKADMTLGMYSTPERMEKLLFTAPYFTNPQVLLARKTEEKVSTDAITMETARFGITSVVAQDYLAGKYPNAKHSMYSAAADAMLALQSDKLDYVMTSRSTAFYMMKQNADLKVAQDGLVDEGCYIAVSKERPDLKEKVDTVLTQFKGDGTLDELNGRWVADGPDYYRTMEISEAEGKNGVLKVALSPDVPPICFIQDGECVGINLELIQRIAWELDMKVEFVTMDFDALLPAIQSGKVDLAISDINATDERRELVDFTQPYFSNPQVLVTKKEILTDTNTPSTFTQTKESLGESLRNSFTRTFLTENRWNLVLDGLKVTVLISICAGFLGSLMGFGICMLRRSKKRYTYLPAAAFIRLVQGTPIVVLLMILYYIIFGKLDISAILVAIIGFAVNFGVYVSEMMRTGIDAVDKGQIEAAYALGFTKVKTFWKITFPQAARHFLPIFKGEFISMVKMTSVVGYIAIQDLTKVSDIIRSRTLEAFFPLIATAVIYFMVANVLTALLTRLEIRLDPKRRKRAVKGVVMK